MIKSKFENQFVYELLRNTSDAGAGWIGLHRRADKKFYWLDNRTKEVNLFIYFILLAYPTHKNKYVNKDIKDAN